MKIAIDGNEANIVERVGVNQYAAGLLSALERLPRAQKHEWTIYLKENPLAHMPKERAGWSYKILPGGSFWVLRKLMLFLWSTTPRPDVLFTPSHYTPLFLPFPMVVSIMDIGYLQDPRQFRKYDFYQLKYWGAWSMFRAKRIIAISESTKKDIVERYPWTRPKVRVTYPGYDKQNFQFHSSAERSSRLSSFQVDRVKRKYDIKGEYILFLGTLKPSKNIEGLLEAYRLLLANARDAGRTAANLNLVIAGKKGWLFDSVFGKVQELGLENFVIFTDFVPEEDKPALLAGAKVLVSPSFWEGFGMHVLEAMACGTPVVVSKVGSLPEIVGKTGILVDPGSINSIYEGMKKVVGLPQIEYNDLVKRVLAQAQKFSWEETASGTVRILEEAVE